MSQPASVLVVEDDDATRDTLAAILVRAGYIVATAADGRAALALLVPGHSYDVLVSDIFLGDIDGIELLKAARALPEPPAVILFTGYSTIQSAVEALRAGAHDYLLKPYRPEELLTTVGRAVEQRRSDLRRAEALRTIVGGLRRLDEIKTLLGEPEAPTSPASERFLRAGPLTIDRYARTLTVGDQPLRLTPTEYQLLLALAESAGLVRSYGELVQRIYGYDEPDERRARLLLKGHVHNLRLKIGADLIASVRGAGYRLETGES